MRKRPRQSRSRALVDSVVQATIDLLERSGRKAPTMREIARRAGVGVGSIYDYFDNREGILDAVHERLMRENFDQLLARWNEYEPLPFATAVGRLLDDVIEAHLGRPRLIRFALRTLTRLGAEPILIAERDRFTDQLAVRVAREHGVSREEARDALIWPIDMVLGAIVSEMFREDPESRRAALQARLQRMLMHELEHLSARPTV